MSRRTENILLETRGYHQGQPDAESPPRDLYAGEMIPVTQITVPEGMLLHECWYVFDAKTKTLRQVTTEEIYRAAQTMDSDDGMH